MSRNAYHQRGEVLHAVVAAANQRRDGALPLDLPGVAETFHDPLDLVSALSLRWHARLGAAIEAELAGEPLDLPVAVARAWRRTEAEASGLRRVLDHCTEHPTDPAMAAALGRARHKEWTRLAAVAGLAHDESKAAARAGRGIVEQARSPGPTGAATPVRSGPRSSLAERIRALVAA